MILNTEQKPVERVVETAFARIKTLVDGDTVIGRPMTMEDGTTIVPISRVTLGSFLIPVCGRKRSGRKRRAHGISHKKERLI